MKYFYKTPQYMRYAIYLKNKELKKKIEEKDIKLLKEIPDKIKEKYITFIEQLKLYKENINDIEYDGNIISAYDFIEAMKKEFFSIYESINNLMNFIKDSSNEQSFLGNNRLSTLKKSIENIVVIQTGNYIEIQFHFYFDSLIKYNYNTFVIKKNIYTNEIYYKYDKSNFTKVELKYLKNTLQMYTDEIFNKETYLINNYDNRYIESREEILTKLLNYIKIIDNSILIDLNFNNRDILSKIKISIDINNSINLYTIEEYFKINNPIIPIIWLETKIKILKKFPINLENLTKKSIMPYFYEKNGDKTSIYDMYINIINSYMKINKQSEKTKIKTR